MNLEFMEIKQLKIDVSVNETYMTTEKGPKFRILEYPLSNNNKTIKREGERVRERERDSANYLIKSTIESAQFRYNKRSFILSCLEEKYYL